MNRLLQIELQKIKQHKASKVLILSYFILLSCIALIASTKFKMGPIELDFIEQGVFNFPHIWHFSTYISAILKLFLAIVIVSMIANEYNYGTLKQNLIDGLSKKEFILSKFLTIILFALSSTLFVFILSLILGLFFSTAIGIDIICSDLIYLIAYFIKLTGFFSFCLFLGILIKRSAFALGFLFVWNIFEGIISGIMKYIMFSDPNTANLFSQLLPLESMSNLIRSPFRRLAMIQDMEQQLPGGFGPNDYNVHAYQILIVLVWVCFFIFLSYRLLEKRDL